MVPDLKLRSCCETAAQDLIFVALTTAHQRGVDEERKRIREIVEGVARYDLHGDADYISSMQPDDDGEYVFFDDLLARIGKGKDENNG